MPANSGITNEELALFEGAQKGMLNILSKLFGYCFPKLKALTIAGQDMEQIVFNISIGASPDRPPVGYQPRQSIVYEEPEIIDIHPEGSSDEEEEFARKAPGAVQAE